MKGIIKKLVLENYPNLLFGESFNDDHLGGCNVFGDPGTECPKMWKYIIDKYDVKSVLDIGCGFGYHLKYFKEVLNLDIYGVEGSDKVRSLSFFPEEIIGHDYTTGISPMSNNIDLVWSVEFLEHVDSQYVHNFMKDFEKSKYAIVTHSTPGQGGHHHVNCQHSEYWINIFREYGFEHDPEETNIIRNLTIEDFEDYLNWCRDTNPDKQFRSFACNESESNSVRIMNAHPHVPETALFFKKIK
jgi:SAM-dependent methyltransferase